jgi:hypothetical protein
MMEMQERIEKLTQRCEELCGELEQARAIREEDHAILRNWLSWECRREGEIKFPIGAAIVQGRRFRRDADDLRAQLAEAQRDTETARKSAMWLTDQLHDSCKARNEEQRDVERLRIRSDTIDEIIGDDEWWEEAAISYSGDYRGCLRSHFDDLDAAMQKEPCDGLP